MALIIPKKRRGRTLPAIMDDFFSMNSFFESSLLDFNEGFLSEHNFPVTTNVNGMENGNENQTESVSSGLDNKDFKEK